MPDGRALFVPLTAPGDRVMVRVIEKRRRYARGEMHELILPGVGRREPRCPVFGSCGGCSWQHLDYPVQLEAKRSILQEALRRIGKLPDVGEIAMHGSPRPYHYRSRARLHVEEGGIGFRQRRSHRLCRITGCPVLVEPLDRSLEALSHQSREDSELEIAVGDDGAVRVASLDSEPGDREGPAAPVVYLVEGHRMRVSPGVFCQANSLLRGPLVTAVREAATQGRSGQADLLLELYCGAGLFTLALAGHFEHVLAVESDPAALGDLEWNLQSAGWAQVEILPGRVEERLAEFSAADARRPDVVVLDPPRGGLAPGAAELLAGLGAPRIVYLSCDPATLARDLAELSRAGYRVAGVQGFDVFPQTAHVEALAVLTSTPPP